MSAFDLGGDDRRALLEHARLNVASQLAPEDSELEKTATGAGMGTMRGLAESGRTALKLAGAAPVVYDAAKSAVTGKDTTSAQDAFFKAFTDDVGKSAIEYWTPQAEHTNKAGDIIGGVAGGLTQFAASGFNPFLFGAQAGLNTQGSLADQGVDLETSSKVGGVTAVASAAGAFLPPSVGGTLVKKLVSGAAINLTAGAAERAVDGSILQGSGYEEQAKQFDWSDPTAAAVDALMGSAFSVAPGSLPASKVKELQDSVLTVASANHAALDVAPGIPVTPGSAAIHHKALSTAIEQIVKGEPVDVGERINKAEFSLRDELPSIKQMRGDLTDLLHEDGRNQFAQQLLDHQGADGPYKTHEEARFVVDQFGAGIQKLHGAGVSMDRLSQLRTSFGKPSEDGAVFNQQGISPAGAFESDPLAQFWSQVGSHADAYKYGRSDKTAMQDILKDADPTLTVAKESADLAEAMNADNALRVETATGKTGYFYEKGGEVWIDVSTIGEGEAGSKIYNAAANYAANNGKVFIGDPEGLSDVAVSRRLENMVSSAIKYGTTSHLRPHEKQLKGAAGVSPIAWKEGSHADNLRGMLIASVDATEVQFPEIKNVRYNFDTAKFEDVRDGTEWTDKRFDSLAGNARLAEQHGADGKNPRTAGRTTLKRAALTRSFLREQSDGKHGLLVQRSDQLQKSLPGALREILYQKGGDAFARNINGDTADPQGQINFGIDGEKLNAVISLFGTADKSTALHELSHNFLEIYKHLNQFEDTPASIKEDYSEMRRLIGADDMGSPLKTEHHERFAQAFEQYTREGKAPTPALKRAFEHFKEWMTAIYQRAADLGAPINDDMRAMFDKMLGKEAEVNHFDPLLKNPDVQNELRRQAKNAGWAEVGGKVIMDENRVVTGRTAWIPKEEWYTAGMGSQADVERIVGKAIRGEKLGKKQQAVVEAMLASPAHDAAREDLQLNDAFNSKLSGETPEQKAARMAEMDAFFDSIPEAAGVSTILNSAQDLSIPQEDGSFMSARELMDSLHAELQEADAMPKVYDAAINCFLRG